MTLTSRTGAAPLTFLLGGIALVVVIFAFATMGNQAKASADLKTKLDEANGSLVAAGLPAKGASSDVKGASTLNLKKTKRYSKGNVSFNYPASLKSRETGDDYVEFASDEDLFGKSSIPNGEILVKVKFDITLQLNTLEDYANRAPYAIDHKVSLADGHQVMTISNEQGPLKWDQMIAAKSPQGPYIITTAVPSGTKATQVIELFKSTLKINDEAK